MFQFDIHTINIFGDINCFRIININDKVNIAHAMLEISR